MDVELWIWQDRALAAEAKLARIEKLFPGGIFLGEDHDEKLRLELAEDAQAGIVEVSNANPLPVDPFFHVG